MDRRQRTPDAVEQFRSAFAGLQSEMQTALPGVIDSVDFDKMTCTVQPGIMAQVTAQDDSKAWVELPLLLDCPIVFPSGGGFTLTFPLKQGDECLVIFASRCIDNWFAQAGDKGDSGFSRTQAEIRMHDLSDGFVLPGIRNTMRPINEVSTADVQLRSDEGSSFVSVRVNGDILAQTDAKAVIFAAGDVNVTSTEGNVNVTATVGDVVVDAGGDALVTAGGDINLTAALLIAGAATSIALSAPIITLAGDVMITGTLSVNGTNYHGHVHSQGTYKVGSSNVTGISGGPTP